MRRKRIFSGIIVLSGIAILVFGSEALGANQQMQDQTELPQPDIPRPQPFCGYCHILTYPNIVQKGYQLWKKGKHNKFGCVQCHYPPKEGEGKSQTPSAGEGAQSKHIPKKPPERFSYVKLGGETIQTRPRIVDASCLNADCHGKSDDKFKTKKIKFTEKVTFVHQPHLEKKNQIEGQQIHCTSCHQHETENKKFEVSKATCNLCHFNNVKFNEGRGKCELCHELPKKPIQTSGEEPITHETIKKANVSCGSCHYDLIQTSGRAEYEAYFEGGVLKTALILGAGGVTDENCLVCHDRAETLPKDIENKKLMHEKHVTIKSARCLDCHQPIVHKKADLKIKQPAVKKAGVKKSVTDQLMRDQFIRNSCMTCHPEPHRLQRLLRAGLKREGVPETLGFHIKVRANCMACHKEEGVTDRGERILKASAKACGGCHKGRENLLKEWKTDLDKVTKETKKVEKEATEALAKAKLSRAKLAKAKKMFQAGQESLHMVQWGNGVHNKKYAMYLLDAAITSFYDVIDYLEEAE